MYTLLELQAKTFGELKKIGYELNVLPKGDQRCRQSWIDAIAGVNPPLLALLEVSPAGEVQAQKPIIEMVENAPGVEVEPVQAPKFGCIVYPKPAVKLIAHEEARPQLDRAQSADVHNLGSHPTKSDRDSSDAKTEALGSQEGDRVLAVARHCQTGGGRVLPDQSTKLVNFTEADQLENEPRMSQSAIVQAAENSPGVEVDRAQEPIGPVAENPPGVEVDQAQEPIGPVAENPPGVEVDQARDAIISVAKTFTAKVSSSKKVKANSYLDCPSCGIGRLRVKQSIYWETSCTKCGYFAESTLYPFTPADTGYKVGDWVKLRIKPRLATNIRRGEVVCIEKVCDDYLRFVNPNLPDSLVLWARRQFLHPHQVSPCEPPVVKAAETSPGVKTEATVSKSPIIPVVKNHIEEESDPNQILTGITFSDRFLARYSPPQSENICFQVKADGQLSLLDFEVQSEIEPPDPDDFESLDAFREAISRWDREHPSSLDHFSDHCSDQNEPPDPYEFDSMFAFWAAYDAWDETEDDSEPLEISLDSFCEWVRCLEDWYEPQTLLEQSKVSELSSARRNSITSDFFIPTFGSLGDRFNGSDEPPDTGIFARLPKPKPPTFPPQVASWTQAGHKLETSWTQVGHKSAQVSNKLTRHPETIPKLSRNYPETIPKLFHRVAAGSSTQPARSPPGGDSM